MQYHNVSRFGWGCSEWHELSLLDLWFLCQSHPKTVWDSLELGLATGLATFFHQKRASPSGLAIYLNWWSKIGTCHFLLKKCCWDLKMASHMGLAIIVIKKYKVQWQIGKSHGTCHFPNIKRASPMGLAIFSFRKWQVPRDLPLFYLENGKSHGTCPFMNKKMASPMGLAILRFGKGQVPWDLPLLN